LRSWVFWLDKKKGLKRKRQKTRKQERKFDNFYPNDCGRPIREDSNKTVEVFDVKFDSKKTSPLIFNTRIESIINKQFWNKLFKLDRCLIATTGFYEWKTEDGIKKKYLITLKDRDFFFFPSVSVILDDKVFISIITTEPNRFMQKFHQRMPAIVLEENVEKFFLKDKIDILPKHFIYGNEIQMLMRPL